MTLNEVKKLHCGDEVYWTDPDGGLCSRHYKIKAISINSADDDDEEAIICLEDEDGSYVEVYAHELS